MEGGSNGALQKIFDSDGNRSPTEFLKQLPESTKTGRQVGGRSGSVKDRLGIYSSNQLDEFLPSCNKSFSGEINISRLARTHTLFLLGKEQSPRKK